MKKLILLSLILSFGILAQEKKDKYPIPKSLNELTPKDIQNKYTFKSYDWDGELTEEERQQQKYIAFKPLSWDELQLYQMDSLLTAEELKLSKHCPTTLKKLQATYRNINAGFQHILGTNYIWSEYENNDGTKCLVKHKKIDTITPKDGKIINPNHYELLNTQQARILLSASRAIGFNEKGLNEKFKQARMHNQKIKNKPYEKYGGIHRLSQYMDNHKQSYQLDKGLVKSLKHKDGNGTRQLPLYQLFEMTYSQDQIRELIEMVKKEQEENEKKSH